MEAKLAGMRDGRGAVSPEARAAAEAVARAFFDAWTSRRRKFRDAYDALLEGTDKKPAVLKEEARLRFWRWLHRETRASFCCTHLSAADAAVCKHAAGV